jgi:hypothetical protein
MRIGRIVQGISSLIFYLMMCYLQLPIGLFGPFNFLSYTYFYDICSYFIVIGQIRALFLILGLTGRCWPILGRWLWGFLVFATLTVGSGLGMLNFKPGSGIITPSPDGSSWPWLDTLATISHIFLGCAITTLASTMICMLEVLTPEPIEPPNQSAKIN